MKEIDYYKIMESFNTEMSFEEIHEKWFKCFSYILNSFKKGFNKKSITSLFYDFDMCNWEVFHQENTFYKDKSKEDLIYDFVNECAYICDRTSYDRLFRTHWLFRTAFYKELQTQTFSD